MKTQALIQVNSTLPAEELARLEALLNGASKGAGGFKFKVDPAMPTFEDYAKLRSALTPNASQELCYAGYLAAIAAGVPEVVAYIAYLACINA